jgi:hypothetical protein
LAGGIDAAELWIPIGQLLVPAAQRPCVNGSKIINQSIKSCANNFVYNTLTNSLDNVEDLINI